MLHMKDVYAVPDRHIRYAATKAFFGTKMTEGLSVQSHGVTMLSLVEKLEDLKVGLNNDTYIDVILQSLPPSYDPFIVSTVSSSILHPLVTATASTGGAPPIAPKEKGKEKVGASQQSRANDVCIHCHGKGHWKRECLQLLSHPGMFVVEINMISNSASWVLDTGCGAHICNDLQEFFLPAMDRIPLSVGDDLSGASSWKQPSFDLNLSAVEQEIVDQKKEQILDQKKTLSLRLGDGKAVAAEAVGSLSLVVSNHVRIELKDCYYVPSMWTPPGTPQLNGVAERRNRTLLDMVRSMMSFTELPPSFWGHALKTAVKLLNISPSKSIPQTPCLLDIQKKLRDTISMIRPSKRFFVSRNAVFLEKGFPSDNQRDEVLIEESSGEPPRESTASFEPTVHTDSVPILRRSTRESRVPGRYGFVGLTSQLDNDRKTYGEAMSDIDSDK
ncbi:UNVERIFIED_CONTAM: hypothetical protein Sradi_7153100 [Sesamum radiatum]|uniref:Integrase catalytic domain-containing protein n=1 Tax=Sesamum radiatum TaxID=300843 RepID=A0AAW2IVV6_SESRA